jgi:hypothetical protein
MPKEKAHYLIPAAEKAYFESREILCGNSMFELFPDAADCEIVEHHNLPETQEHDIFLRIQQGMVLLSGGAWSTAAHCIC